MKRNDMMVNYLLSISLILVVIILVVLLVSMSRFILSDVNPVGAHLINTQSLLEDVDNVRDAAVDPSKVRLSREDSLRLSYPGLEIDDIAYINVNETRAIVTMFFNARVGSIGESIYYIRINDTLSLRQDEILVYEYDGIRLGEFVSLTDQGDLIILDSLDSSVVEIGPQSVLGRAFFTASQENDNSAVE